MKNKLYRVLSSPGAQMISFSTLMFAGDKIGGPLFILLFLNTFFGDLNFSLFGWVCYLIPIICIYKKIQISIFLQLVSTILMISFVVTLFGPSYFTHFIIRFSTQDVAIMSISYGFFILVNLAVFLKFVQFFKFRINQS
jgi:hypothetical protein